jgi:hypothetical protein
LPHLALVDNPVGVFRHLYQIRHVVGERSKRSFDQMTESTLDLILAEFTVRDFVGSRPPVDQYTDPRGVKLTWQAFKTLITRGYISSSSQRKPHVFSAS